MGLYKLEDVLCVFTYINCPAMFTRVIIISSSLVILSLLFPTSPSLPDTRSSLAVKIKLNSRINQCPFINSCRLFRLTNTLSDKIYCSCYKNWSSKAFRMTVGSENTPSCSVTCSLISDWGLETDVKPTVL